MEKFYTMQLKWYLQEQFFLAILKKKFGHVATVIPFYLYVTAYPAVNVHCISRGIAVAQGTPPELRNFEAEWVPETNLEVTLLRLLG